MASLYTDRLMKFAARQTAILVAVLLSVPVAGGIVILTFIDWMTKAKESLGQNTSS